MDIIRQIQLHQVKILEEIIKIFDSENLTYFAIGGTALGAVRHQGFIPWDDDIDIAMPREDYDTFLTLQDKLPNHLFIQHYSTEPDYPLYITKVRDSNTVFIEKRMEKYNINHGVFIDIFPWDNIHDMDEQKKSTSQLHNKIRRCGSFSFKYKQVSEFIKLAFYKAIYGFPSTKVLRSQLEQEYRKYNHHALSKLGNPQFNDCLDKSDLFPLQSLNFESIKINCPKNIEKYLSEKYGDYMTIPDVHDRGSHHPTKIVL